MPISGFFLPFSKNSRPKKLKALKNSRPFFSQKLNVSEIFEAPAKKLKAKIVDFCNIVNCLK